VKMELDVSWAFASGVDPTDYLARCPGRFPLLHLKDWRPTVHASDIWSHAFAPGPPAKGTITNVGSGSIDWSRVLQHAETAGVQHLVIEHDAPPAPLDDLRTSFEYLRSL